MPLVDDLSGAQHRLQDEGGQRGRFAKGLTLVVIFVIGLVVAAFAHGGLYELRGAGGDIPMAFRVNKLTGAVAWCLMPTGECVPFTEKAPGQPSEKQPARWRLSEEPPEGAERK